MRIAVIAAASTALLLTACGEPAPAPEAAVEAPSANEMTTDEMAGGDEARSEVNDDRADVNDDRAAVNDDRADVNDDRSFDDDRDNDNGRVMSQPSVE